MATEIFMDGRELPKDPNPTWRGYSVGRWEGDTLVVETAGFSDSGWLDQIGHPRSEKLHVTERFRRFDFGLQFQMTLEDPEMMNRPLTISPPVSYMADTSMVEYVCNENERDRAHFVGRELKAKVQLSAAALEKYVGIYASTAGRGNNTVSLVNNQLYWRDLPLFPQSETLFDSRGSQVEFFLDSHGDVTGADTFGAAGDQSSWVRKR